MRSGRLIVAALATAVASCCAAGANAAPPLFLLSGGGLGHGVGMSQYGAEGYALHGYTYRHILAHYYPGTSLSSVRNHDVRVRLLSGRSRVVIGSSAPFRVIGGRGHSFVLPAGEQGVTNSFSVLVHRKRRPAHYPLRFEPGSSSLTLNGAAYRGSLVVETGVTVVNTIPVESYLRGVVPAEMPSHWLQQALRAQAVVARSYALASRQPLYADTRSQMYLGIGAERPSTDAAVADTAGRVLTWHHRVATTYFSSTSGGRTAANEDAWPGSRPVPYLRSVADPYDTISPYHRWRPQLLSSARLGSKLGVGRVDDVEVTSASSGWARAVRVRTPAGTRTFGAAEFANRLGLRSQSFRVGVLQLESARSSTVYGGHVVLHGLVRDLEARLQARRPGGSWHDAEPSLVVRPLRTTEYRLAAVGIATAPVRVDVSPALLVQRSQRALSGRVAPALGSLHLSVQRLLRGNWLTIRSARVTSQGAFRLDRSLPVGTYRVKTAATGELLAGESAPIRVP